MALAPSPTRMEVDRDQRCLKLRFDTGEEFELPFEYLRVYSPSAEVRGHTPEEYTLQTGKRAVGIERIDPQGNYAVCIHFDDGHSSGIYTWEWLYELASKKEEHWGAYLAELDAAGASRDPNPLTILSD